MHPLYSLDHDAALSSLAATPDLLLIQDLDGVCMPLARDPLTRTLARHYIEAARGLDGHFQVLTNGEHIGRRGVNGIVERALGDAALARSQGLYLPGLGAGGIQLQDRFGAVSHPGVSEAELAFLAGVPQRARQALRTMLASPPFEIPPDELERLVETTVLDNPASPTLNLNGLHHRYADRPGLYARLQQTAAAFMAEQLRQAEALGLGAAFFVHYAPNLGHEADGRERIKPADAEHAGTTDFQLMLRGAVKEVGVLVALNHYYARRTGSHPLGERFNAREAPHTLDALLDLAERSLDKALMPRLVGVGDTVTSVEDADGTRRRGGSDRGFLTLVQNLGRRFGRDNLVCYVDSSGGEVRRAGIDAALLAQARDARDPRLWQALSGISDADDPLRLNLVFPLGYGQYVDFFCRLAARRGQR
ncbi:glucosylglycerol 3-phosphatase [Sinimarinibacterium flocculans]|uniref:glucosylglycerol 3-phosphatase n=1 Tax=Sinimarinibacterium flocculans TaxID=985250 RepID=UPI002490D423|nr:glucosylglycerol 3-phosphatase [Sinimarinibacterium flocculans]